MGIKARVGVIGGALALFGLMLVLPASAGNKASYNAIPSVLPGNVASVGFEAYQASELGQLVTLQPHHGQGKKLSGFTAVMSSWGCKTGTWFGSDCHSPAKATFGVPITLNVYAVDNSGPLPEPGALLKSVTKTFQIHYRPSVDNVDCDNGQWFNTSDSTCYNGFAQKITYAIKNGPSLPTAVIWTLQYNTTHYGPSPIGESAACFTSSGGCGYDSLNIGTETLESPTVGTQPDPDGIFWNTQTAGNYCDGGAGGTGTLRDDTNGGVGPICWTGYQPIAKIVTQ